jgi:hypothetical protein
MQCAYRCKTPLARELQRATAHGLKACPVPVHLFNVTAYVVLMPEDARFVLAVCPATETWRARSHDSAQTFTLHTSHPPGNLERDLSSPDEDASSPPSPIDGLPQCDSSPPQTRHRRLPLPRCIRRCVANNGLRKCSCEHCRCCRPGGQLHVQCADTAGQLAAHSEHHAKRGPPAAAPLATDPKLTNARPRSTKQKETTRKPIFCCIDMPTSSFRSCKPIRTGTSLRTARRSMQQPRPCIAT